MARQFTRILTVAAIAVSLMDTVGGANFHSRKRLANKSAFTNRAVDVDVELTLTRASVAPATTVTTSVARGGEAGDSLAQRLRIGFYFALWYTLNVVYNVLNKKYLNVIPAPLTVGSLQFGVGALYSVLLWATSLRPAPVLTEDGNKAVRNVGFYHMSGQELSMMSLGAGPVSFTHIVKALEPFFSAVVSALVFGKWMAPQVYATLIPVVGGVAYACLKVRRGRHEICQPTDSSRMPWAWWSHYRSRPRNRSVASAGSLSTLPWGATSLLHFARWFPSPR